ncbi:hypothetical protein [Actinocrispum wychmicini]|uniref:Uncharacterized protein n=1 Tax=Actinocrispum wychmicini TaxID=1213861 RepID=A0A4R2IW69_9PSEU|nr:hypothetical protein [Actinocrispum wychmicini]TCO49664.1 hypothetical protein EV192_11429 [Actinocrispum wychmicini]
MLTIEFTPSDVLPTLDPQLGDQLGDELLLASAKKRADTVKAGLHSRTTGQRHNTRAWTAGGHVD